jgi:hypothetical protein
VGVRSEDGMVFGKTGHVRKLRSRASDGQLELYIERNFLRMIAI